MRTLFLILLAALVVLGPGDEWVKVKALKMGAELRVYKKGSTQALSALMVEITDENLIVMIKKTETAIPKDQIDRIDARSSGGSRATKETTTKDAVGPDELPTSSVSTGHS
jgi:hypothetical protein